MDESRLCVPHSLTDTADPALMALTSCTNTLGRGRGRRGLSCSLPDVEFPPQISCPAAPASGALVYLSDFAYAKKKKKSLKQTDVHREPLSNSRQFLFSASAN